VTNTQVIEDLESFIEDAKVKALIKTNVHFAPDAYSAAQGAHALLTLTEWDEFTTLDFARIHAGMMKPAFVFDGRLILDSTALRNLGFEVFLHRQTRHYAAGIPVQLGSRRRGWAIFAVKKCV